MLDEDNGNDDSVWEDGFVSTLSSKKDRGVDPVSIEFDVLKDLPRRETVWRATAEQKEVAELIHKAHLLCLLGRGRLMDGACDDQLIQASLLSLVPQHLLKIAERPKLTASCLSPLVSWFRRNFQVSSSSVSEKSCHLSLASALETREGTPEAVTALSVALFRALNLTTRLVYMLDVACLKPDRNKTECTTPNSKRKKGDIFCSSTLMTAEPSSSVHSMKSLEDHEQSSSKSLTVCASRNMTGKSMKCGFKGQDSDTIDNEAPNDFPEPCSEKATKLKRKGDLEFEMQLAVALAATAAGSSEAVPAPNEESYSTSTLPTPPKKMKRIVKESSDELSTAIGSKKVGAPIYWAEVFCNGENLTGKWVHVDAVNSIIDEEDKVEAAAAACKKSMRYVVAFAGRGAKDVTRRYCIKWYKIAAQRVNPTWWDSVLAPLKELESGATGGFAVMESEAAEKKIEASQVEGLDKRNCMENTPDSSLRASSRSALEDMELETRALTEPLPTNQQAYRNHKLYVIERWLKKFEALHPKGPVLGYCAGHAVYPRTCVQTLHTKEIWLREGLQVKDDQTPAKIVKRHQEQRKYKAVDDGNCSEENHEATVALYGKWQTEPLCLPRAVDGRVPKNERGQVDVWSEKSLPPGTVHLPYPRIFHLAKTLGIDYAPAMVGFEFRNGRSVPVFDGIVVCTEFKDTIIDAYFEEEKKREAREKRTREAQALSRWYQLLSSS